MLWRTAFQGMTVHIDTSFVTESTYGVRDASFPLPFAEVKFPRLPLMLQKKPTEFASASLSLSSFLCPKGTTVVISLQSHCGKYTK